MWTGAIPHSSKCSVWQNILHFDGHGAYGAKDGHDNPHALTLQGLQGRLVFEDERGEPDPQPAETLSELLEEQVSGTVSSSLWATLRPKGAIEIQLTHHAIAPRSLAERTPSLYATTQYRQLPSV